MANQALRMAIAQKYHSESECARTLGWSKQKLSKTIIGTRHPKISDLSALSEALNMPVGEVIDFFMRQESTE